MSSVNVDLDTLTIYHQSQSGNEVDLLEVTLLGKIFFCDWLVFNSFDRWFVCSTISQFTLVSFRLI